MLLSKRPEMFLPDKWPSYFESTKGCQVIDLDGEYSFLANDIVDPYHQWPLTNSQFNESMKAKYGSLETARSKILHYKQVNPAKNNEPTGTTISKETYDLHTGGTVGVLPGITKAVNAANYKPVYAYDYEQELNDAKREIRLVDYRMANKATELLRKAMNG